MGRPFRTRRTRPFATPTPVERAPLDALRLGIASRAHGWHILKRGASNPRTSLAHPHRWNIESNNRFGASSLLELPKAEVARRFPKCGSWNFRTRFEGFTLRSPTNENP